MAIDYLLYFCIMSRLFCDDDGHDGGGDDDDDDDDIVVVVAVVIIIIIITTIVVPKQPKCSITISIICYNSPSLKHYIHHILYIPKDPRRPISHLETELGINSRPRLLFNYIDDCGARKKEGGRRR